MRHTDLQPLVDAIRQISSQDLYIKYDSSTGTVYIHFDNESVADDGVLLEDNTIVRFNKEEEVIGFTFMQRQQV